jgi:hypothetical protein
MPSRCTLCLLSAAVSTSVTYCWIADRNQSVAAKTAYWFDYCATLFDLAGDCYTHVDHHDIYAKVRLKHLRDEARSKGCCVSPSALRAGRGWCAPANAADADLR